MNNSSTNHSSLAETDASIIRSELNRLLSDRRFSGARQMSAFLRYIVCETLAGNGARIKAYTVGVDALGKPDDFDAQADPSVRVLALRLRKTLAAAYEGHPECAARIVLRVGTYVPEFYKPEAFAEPDLQAVLPQSDHASVNGVDSTAVSDDVSSETQQSGSGVPGHNGINRHSDNQRRALNRGVRVDSASHDVRQETPPFQRLPRNAVAFSVADFSRSDLCLPLVAACLMLLGQMTLNPVKADSHVPVVTVEHLLNGHESVKWGDYAPLAVRGLD